MEIKILFLDDSYNAITNLINEFDNYKALFSDCDVIPALIGKQVTGDMYDNIALIKEALQYQILLVDYSWTGDTGSEGLDFMMKLLDFKPDYPGKMALLTDNPLIKSMLKFNNDALKRFGLELPLTILKVDKDRMIEIKDLVISFLRSPSYSPKLGKLLNKILLHSGLDLLLLRALNMWHLQR
ncbi:MAG: hypothetical protein HQK94_16660 [Nitrospirae bacterium]|nr:hypothetical protein [Nitrospirota bacterium]